MIEPSLRDLEGKIIRCRACPRLVAWREKVARVKVARYRACDYWGLPVPGFGDPNARILIVGLAPGAHGANRTGRMFTGDRSGDFLFSALHRAGLATRSSSTARDDGLALLDTYIVAAIRCAPPDNRPERDELERCSPFLDREIALLPHVRVVLVLGAIAWRAYLDHLERSRVKLSRPRPAFSHGATVCLGASSSMGHRLLIASYHVSQQNTQTGKLTRAMFDAILTKALAAAC